MYLTCPALATEQCVLELAASAVLFPSSLAGRRGPVGFGCHTRSIQLALSGTVQDTLPPVDFHPPTTPPLAQPIHDNPELTDFVTV